MILRYRSLVRWVKVGFVVLVLIFALLGAGWTVLFLSWRYARPQFPPPAPAGARLKIPSERRLTVVYVPGVGCSRDETDRRRTRIREVVADCLIGDVVVKCVYVPTKGSLGADLPDMLHKLWMAHSGRFARDDLTVAEDLKGLIDGEIASAREVLVVAHSYGGFLAELCLSPEASRWQGCVGLLLLGAVVNEDDLLGEYTVRRVDTACDPASFLTGRLRYSLLMVGPETPATKPDVAFDAHNLFRGYLADDGARSYVENGLVEIAKELFSKGSKG